MFFLLAIFDKYDPSDDSVGTVVSTSIAGADDLPRLAGLLRYYGYTPIKDRPWHYVCGNGRLCYVVGGFVDCAGSEKDAVKAALNDIGASILGMSRIDLALFNLFDVDDMMAAL